MGTRGRPEAELALSTRSSPRSKDGFGDASARRRWRLRSRIELACAKGTTNRDVAGKLGVNQATVSKWRSRFVAHRLEGLTDEPRSGAPRTVTNDDVERSWSRPHR